MAGTLSKSIVLYSASVFMEVIPRDSRLPAATDLRFPLEVDREPSFHFQVGQMAGLTPDEGDFEQVTDIYLDELPQSSDGTLDVWVVIHLSADKELYVEVRFTRLDDNEPLADSLFYGPFEVS